MTTATAIAASSCTTGTLAAAAVCSFISRRRTRFDRFAKARLFVALTAEDLHHLLVLDALLQHVIDVTHRLLGLAREPAQAPIERTHHERNRRDHQEGDQRELPVQPQQIGEQRDDGERIADQHRDDVGHRNRDLDHVEGELGDQLPAQIVGEVAQRKRKQLARTSAGADP